MNIKEQYLRTHFARKRYSNEMIESARKNDFADCGKWTDYFIYNNLIFSYRNNYYTKETFDEGLHSHPFYEVVIYIRGNVRYIQNNTVTHPEEFFIMCFPPDVMHTASLVSASDYERYVLYFSPEFFSSDDTITPVLDFLKNKGYALSCDELSKNMLKNMLNRTHLALKSDKEYKALLSKSIIVEIFDLLNSSEFKKAEIGHLNLKIAEIKTYIDKNFSVIDGATDIAEHFFYSREHISRNFKKCFNISLSEYLKNKRIMESLKLLQEKSVTETCFLVGFKSQSAFISAFEKSIGCLPSEYKKSVSSKLQSSLEVSFS